VSDKRKKPKSAAKRELDRRLRLALEGRLAHGVEIPPGAVAADLSKQVPNNSYSPRPLFYRDIEFTCTDCGRKRTWTARQQKWYYEVAKGSLYSTAARCSECRRKRAAMKGRGDPNPIKHAGTIMKRIRARIDAPLRAAGFEFAGHDSRDLGRPATIEYVRTGLILRCVFDRREARLIAETLDDRAEYRVIADVALAYPISSAERLQRIDAFASTVAELARGVA
jgi:hypothetical protein